MRLSRMGWLRPEERMAFDMRQASRYSYKPNLLALFPYIHDKHDIHASQFIHNLVRLESLESTLFSPQFPYRAGSTIKKKAGTHQLEDRRRSTTLHLCRYFGDFGDFGRGRCGGLTCSWAEPFKFCRMKKSKGKKYEKDSSSCHRESPSSWHHPSSERLGSCQLWMA